MRGASGKGDPGAKGQRAHVDAAHHVPMPEDGSTGGCGSAGCARGRISSSRMPATFSMFPAETKLEALDAACFGPGGEGGDVLPVQTSPQLPALPQVA
jgi:hypothetical protein